MVGLATTGQMEASATTTSWGQVAKMNPTAKEAVMSLILEIVMA